MPARQKVIFVPLNSAPLSSGVAQIQKGVDEFFDELKVTRKHDIEDATNTLNASVGVVKTTESEKLALARATVPQLDATQKKPKKPEVAVKSIQTYFTQRDEIWTESRGQILPALLVYEKKYLQLYPGWEKIQKDLTAKFGEDHIRFKPVDSGISVGSDPHQGVIEIEASGSDGSPFAPIGHIYIDNSRFAPLHDQPGGVHSTVYTLRGKGAGRQYVFLESTKTYVRRFVVRGLNQYDALHLSKSEALTSSFAADASTESEAKPERHGVAQGTALTQQQQVLSHTRGWTKRFISSGVSNRQILSTRGEPFSSVFGAIVIDLAKLSAAELKQVCDVHSPNAAKGMLGSDAQRVLEAVNADADENLAALRDVLRTRELLIKNQIPPAAMMYQASGKMVLALGWTSTEKREAFKLPDGKPSEKPPYPWEAGDKNATWWTFLLFDSDGQVNEYVATLPAKVNKKDWLPVDNFKIPHYKPVRPASGIMDHDLPITV